MERWQQFQGVYVHTPFCVQKCLYCDFPSYAGFSEEVRQRYTEALCREIKLRSLQRELPVAKGATIYFGGGTPSILSVQQIRNIVLCLKEYGWWQQPAEATIEVNPGTVDTEKLCSLRELGFDRISLGVQSLQDNELRALGRIHTAEQALCVIREAKQAGFQRINVDLMSGIPLQTVEHFQRTLDMVLQLQLTHISVYSLILEEGTPLEKLVRTGQVQLPDEETSYLMYEMTTDVLAKAGLTRYEISNYAAPGQESLHNKVYWRYEPYAAFGAGACSFTGTERRTNTVDVAAYICGWKHDTNINEKNVNENLISNGCVLQHKGSAGIEDLYEAEPLDRPTQLAEAMIMGLRMTDGVSLNEIQKRFGVDILKYYEREIQMLLDKKMATCVNGTLRLTPYGMRYGNRAFESFV